MLWNDQKGLGCVQVEIIDDALQNIDVINILK